MVTQQKYSWVNHHQVRRSEEIIAGLQLQEQKMTKKAEDKKNPPGMFYFNINENDTIQ